MLKRTIDKTGIKNLIHFMLLVVVIFASSKTFAADVWFDTENHGDFSWVWYVDSNSIEKMYDNRCDTVRFIVKLNRKNNITGEEKGWNLWRYRVYTRLDDPYNYYVAGTQKGDNANKISAIPKNDYHMNRIMRIVARYDDWAAAMLP